MPTRLDFKLPPSQLTSPTHPSADLAALPQLSPTISVYANTQRTDNTMRTRPTRTPRHDITSNLDTPTQTTMRTDTTEN
ncbi:hypothetical protein SCHPADRAFT_165183 [Schizopora paradoxa]|uniref:Uncharacterized protein n=1 Tax=Schizopora paradoxa TaxID=27342 RepID=A0A0H2RZK9_9AGAM|nr:hypothetical protein SCHPADRAFT_165183 [Schizopora paradoxa]